jgi:putative ABC transport system ATP-binding protein
MNSAHPVSADAIDMPEAVADRAIGPSADPRRAALEVSDLRFAYGPRREILRIPDLRVDAGSSVLFFGPSGSGKTTLLGLLAGVLTASSGRLIVLGHDLTQMSNAERDRFRGSHIGYIFQLFNLIPYLTVLENITLPCRLSRERHERLDGVPLERAANDVAEHLGIAPLLGERARDLSVGQQQRVAAARALIGTPEIVIADEPTSSLDFDHRGRFLDLLFASCRRSGSTVVFVSHDRTLRCWFDRCVSLPEINRAVP